MKQGANPVDKKDIAALAEDGMTAKQISKQLLIEEKIVKNWMPEVAKKAAK